MSQPQHDLLLSVSRLDFSRSDEAILADQSLTVEAGELLLVRGLNGTGKTTILKILAGLLMPDRGELAFAGKSVAWRDHDYLRQVAYLGHYLAIKEDLSCTENLTFWGQLEGVSVKTRDILRRVGLAGYAHSLARELSAGQHKRLAIARLLLRKKRLWLLDEPYSNLDMKGIALVDDVLGDHLAAQGAAIATSHGTFTPNLEPIREHHL